jgi:hypothetical protein
VHPARPVVGSARPVVDMGCLLLPPVCVVCSGYRTFNQEVLPILRDAAGLEVEVHTTQGAGHATEIVKGLNLDQVGGGAYLQYCCRMC